MRLSLSDRLLRAVLRVFKILAYLVTTVLLLLAVAGILSQTSYLRNMFRSFLVSTISKNLNGTLRVGAVGGNMIGGFTMDSVVVEQDGLEVIRIDRIDCSYELLGLLQQRIDVTRLAVDSPRVRLVRSAEGPWNLSRLFDPAPDTGAGGFDWEIRLEELRIRGGSLTVVDSQALGGTPGAPRPLSFPASDRFTAEGFDLEGSFRLRGERASASIERLRWTSAEPDFELQQMAFRLTVEPTLSRIEDLTLQTRDSYLELDATLGRSILEGLPALHELRDDSVSLRLTSRAVDYTELSRFLTWIPRGPGSASVRCDAEGPFGRLRIGRLEVAAGGSRVAVNGVLTGLDDPSRLLIDATIAPSVVTMTDLDRFIEEIPEDVVSPDLPVGIAGTFTGSPLDFTTTLDLEGEFGRLSGATDFRLSSPSPSYGAAWTMSDFNPGLLFDTDLPSTLLNGRLELQGSDFDPEAMAANFFLVLEPSRFRGHAVDELQANGTIEAGTIGAEAHAEWGRARADAVFSARLSGDTLRVSSGDLAVASLDLSELLRDTLYRSDITARGNLSFAGSSLRDLEARAELFLLPSSFRGHPMGADSVSFLLDQADPARRKLRLMSSMIEIDLDGAFDLDLMAGTVADRIAALVDAVARHASPADSTAVAEDVEARRTSTRGAAEQGAPGRTAAGRGAGASGRAGAVADAMSFSYRISLSNLLPVGEFLNITPFNVRGSIEGEFSSDSARLDFGLKGVLEEFFIGTVEDGWLMRDATVDLRIGTDGDPSDLSNLTASAGLGVESGFAGGRALDAARLRLDVDDSRGLLAAGGTIDSVLAVNLSGQASIQPEAYVFDFDTLRFRAGEYGWNNDQDVQFRLSPEGLRIMRALFRRGEEEISLHGLVGRRGSLDASLAVRRFDLSVLNLLLPYPELRIPGNGFVGTAGADAVLGGTPESPVFSVSAESENFTLRKTRLGFVESRFNYADGRLDVLIQNRPARASTAPALTVEGRMPANFSLAGSGERFPDAEQRITINADDFDISIFDPLIGELQNLTGRINSDLVIGGTPRNPAYTGRMEFSGVQFLFVPNNLPYRVNGTINAEGSRLALGAFTLENAPPTRPGGRMELSGAITTDRFRIDGFDITGRGDLLIMGEETRRAVPEMYGPLLIRSDTEGITLSGNLARPFLSGTVLVSDAFITFPPMNRQQATPGFRRLNYIVVDDTSAGYRPEEDFLRPFFGGVDGDTARVGGRQAERRLTFLDQLRYNLEVETRGNPSVRFIFSQLSDELLYAELNGRVSVVNDAGEPRIYGSIEIVAPSYYKFYQRFDATGRLRFVGPWDNPELDVTAIYEASHVRPAASEGDDPEVRRVQVVLEITGPRYEPVLTMTLREETQGGGAFVDISAGSTPAEAQSDAISFILTGKFSDELTSGDRSTIAGDVAPGTGAMVGSILTSSLLTGVLEDYLRKEFPFIRSVDVTYEGGSSPGTNVQVSANALKGYLRIGGKILSDVGRASVAYKASLGEIFDASSIRNLFFEIEQRIEAETQKNRNTVEGRIYYRFSF